MCVSAEVSFGMAGVLAVGGIFATKKAIGVDKRYVPLAVFPVFVAIQQFSEGLVWVGLETDSAQLIRTAALFYLFFAWMIWPSWVPFMAARLEPVARKRSLFMLICLAGIALGIILYLPNFWHGNLINPSLEDKSIAYNCTLITQGIVAREIMYALYLSIIALPPLLSSHHTLKIFGAALVAFTIITLYLFYNVGLSVLCFFAAIATLYIIWIIMEDRCPSKIRRPVAQG